MAEEVHYRQLVVANAGIPVLGGDQCLDTIKVEGGPPLGVVFQVIVSLSDFAEVPRVVFVEVDLLVVHSSCITAA